jgi:ribosomal protein L12E/L44/L45/RPP1/RPP2
LIIERRRQGPAIPKSLAQPGSRGKKKEEKEKKERKKKRRKEEERKKEK